MERVDLSKYDSIVINDLIFLESDMIEFLENKIDRNELIDRISYVVDKFERLRKK